MLNLGFTIRHLAFSFPWVGQPKGHHYFTPPGQRSSECWSKLTAAGGHQGQLWAGLLEFGQSECALRTRFVQLLSGFVGTFGRCCWICFNLSKCLVEPGCRV